MKGRKKTFEQEWAEQQEALVMHHARDVFNRRREMAVAVMGRVTALWHKQSLATMCAALGWWIPVTSGFAAQRNDPDMRRSALTLSAFRADLATGGMAKLTMHVMGRVPKRLHDVPDEAADEARRQALAEPVAHEAMRLALAEALGEATVFLGLGQEAPRPRAPDAEPLEVAP